MELTFIPEKWSAHHNMKYFLQIAEVDNESEFSSSRDGAHGKRQTRNTVFRRCSGQNESNFMSQRFLSMRGTQL